MVRRKISVALRSWQRASGGGEAQEANPGPDRPVRTGHDDARPYPARQKGSDAESSEREADRALGQARAAVREAREHVKMLEREALEE